MRGWRRSRCAYHGLLLFLELEMKLGRCHGPRMPHWHAGAAFAARVAYVGEDWAERRERLVSLLDAGGNGAAWCRERKRWRVHRVNLGRATGGWNWNGMRRRWRIARGCRNRIQVRCHGSSKIYSQVVDEIPGERALELKV